MNIIEGQYFENKDIHLDYGVWRNNSFVNCVFHIAVGEFIFEHNELIGGKVSVRGNAEVIARFIDLVHPNKKIFEDDKNEG